MKTQLPKVPSRRPDREAAQASLAVTLCVLGAGLGVTPAIASADENTAPAAATSHQEKGTPASRWNAPAAPSKLSERKLSGSPGMLSRQDKQPLAKPGPAVAQKTIAPTPQKPQ